MRGNVRVSTYEGGELHEYLDLRKRVVRIEHRSSSGELDPSYQVEFFEYDSSGRTVSHHFENASGEPANGPLGFAARRTRREVGQHGESFTHHEHFDTYDQPLQLPAGYFRETIEHSGSRLRSRRFYDLNGDRVAIKLNDFDLVFEVRYAHLKGATPIVMEMYVDEGGVPLFKRKLSGHTERRVEHWYSAYSGYHAYGGNGSYGSYPIYLGTKVTYSSEGDD